MDDVKVVEGGSDGRRSPAAGCKVVPSQQLFHGDREIVIDHEGERYRLRITRRNRLILQK